MIIVMQGWKNSNCTLPTLLLSTICNKTFDAKKEGLIKRENNCKRDFVKKSFLSLLCFIFLEMPKKFYIFLLKGKGMAKNISSYERFGINQYFYVIRMLKILKFCHWSKGSFYRKQKSFMNLESDLFLFMDGILMRIISCVCIKRRIKTWNIKSILSIGNI